MTTTYSLAPWFDVETHGLPRRIGVFEGTGVGIPGEGYVLQHGYYFWNGTRWSPKASTVDEAFAARAKHGLGVSNWRGVIPGVGYPFDAVEDFRPTHYAGELLRDGVSDRLVVSSLERDGHQIQLRAVREWGSREPVVFDMKLNPDGLEFVGRAKPTVAAFELEPVGVRMSIREEGVGTLKATASLAYGPTTNVFFGHLYRPKGDER